MVRNFSAGAEKPIRRPASVFWLLVGVRMPLTNYYPPLTTLHSHLTTHNYICLALQTGHCNGPVDEGKPMWKKLAFGASVTENTKPAKTSANLR